MDFIFDLTSAVCFYPFLPKHAQIRSLIKPALSLFVPINVDRIFIRTHAVTFGLQIQLAYFVCKDNAVPVVKTK